MTKYRANTPINIGELIRQAEHVTETIVMIDDEEYKVSNPFGKTSPMPNRYSPVMIESSNNNANISGKGSPAMDVSGQRPEEKVSG